MHWLQATAGNGYQPVPGSPNDRTMLLDGQGCRSPREKKHFYSPVDMQTPWVCGVGYEVRTVSKVDCVAEEFFADLSIFFKWFDEANKGFGLGEIEASRVSNKPHILIANDINVQERMTNYARLPCDPPGVLHGEMVCTGIFGEFMELENFPLDFQDLSIKIRFVDCRWTAKSLDPTSDAKYLSITGNVELAEWLMYEPHTETGRTALGNATWDLRMKVLRKFRYYLFNVIGVMGLLTSLVFFSFLFEAAAWIYRSAYCATLLLTSVAFKFAVDGSLPKVSFTTILDLYMSVAFGMMVGVVVEAAFVKFLQRMFHPSDEELSMVDTILCCSMTLGWLSWNIVYLCRLFQFEMRQVRRVGQLLPHIATNKASPERCFSFFCCQEDPPSDSEGDLEADCSPYLQLESNSFPNGREAKHAVQFELVG
jgi:hypothetical protein